MSAATVKILIFVGYVAFVLISKAVKAARQSGGPGGAPVPQGAPIRPRAAARPAPPRRVAKARPVARPRPQPPARVAPARKAPPPVLKKAAPAPEEKEGPRHDAAHPVASHFKPEAVEAPPALARLFLNRDDVRKGFLMSEVLGRPLALR